MKNALILFAFATIILFVFLPAYTSMQDLKQKNADYAAEIKALEEKKIDLAAELKLLEEDPEYLEKVAREKMGIARKGEMVVKMKRVEETKK